MDHNEVMTGQSAMENSTRDSDRATGESGQLILELRVPAKADRLKLIRALVRSVCVSQKCHSEIADGMILAVDEACQNVVRHAYVDEGGDLILTVRAEPGCLVYEIRDFASRAYCGGDGPAAPDHERIGGLGTHFIHATMDEVRYVSPPDGGPGTLLRLARYID